MCFWLDSYTDFTTRDPFVFITNQQGKHLADGVKQQSCRPDTMHYPVELNMLEKGAFFNKKLDDSLPTLGVIYIICDWNGNHCFEVTKRCIPLYQNKYLKTILT